jgi:hypothetical protein
MESTDTEPGPFNAKERQALFLEFAAKKGGITAQEVYDEAVRRGDTVTIEAYHNLARRLAHRGLLVADKQEKQTRYVIGAKVDGQWLDEEQLGTLIDPEYPLIALTVFKESVRQINNIPEGVWKEARERLKTVPARQLFNDAIKAYADNLCDELRNYQIESAHPHSPNHLPRLRQEIEASITLLKQLTKFGMGLSQEAIRLPGNFDIAMDELTAKTDVCFYNTKLLTEEINQRVADESIVVEVPEGSKDQDILVAAVDGSTRGGLLTFEGEEGDLSVGHAPMVSINTATAQINRSIRIGKSQYPAFLRLPEKPEDMQQKDNRYTIMAKLFFPDLSDAEYIHSVWNAMDVLESRATLQVMSRWYAAKTNIEIRPADVVMRDGTVVPNARDSSHYRWQNSYGQIVRDLIEINWKMAKNCRDDAQTLMGVVKNAQLRVFSPVINWYFCQLAAKEKDSQIAAWPLRAMNHLPDQVILTRILTAGREKNDPWTRTAIILRPFHAATDLSQQYSRDNTPADLLIKKAEAVQKGVVSDISDEEKWFWKNFRGENDPFIQMLRNVQYAFFYLGAVPRLDIQKVLPRMEFLVPVSTEEKAVFPIKEVQSHLSNLLRALRQIGFEVSAEHSMFNSPAKIDVLPALIVQVHDTVKIWATELLSRVQEYIGYHISRYLKVNHLKSVRVRQWKQAELETWLKQMQRERDRQAGLPDAETNRPRLTE